LSFASACVHNQLINQWKCTYTSIAHAQTSRFCRCDQLSSRSVVIRLSLCTQSTNQSMNLYTRTAHAQNRFCQGRLVELQICRHSPQPMYTISQ
jgi:hypothetical protein